MTNEVKLIKEEIESYMKFMKGLEPHSDFRKGQITAYNHILQFIDSIPYQQSNLWHTANETPRKGELYLYETNQNIIDILRSNGKEMPDYCTRWAYVDDLFNVKDSEEPVSEDLDTEIAIMWSKSCHLNKERDKRIATLTSIEFTEIARHFAKWQKQQDEELFSEDTWNYIEENYPNITEEEKLRLYDVSIKSRLAGAKTQKKLDQETIELAEEHAMLAGMEKMKEEMKAKEHINNIISCLEEYLQPGFPIFKAGISEEITWLNSLINKND